jgi:hypothetical protein
LAKNSFDDFQDIIDQKTKVKEQNSSFLGGFIGAVSSNISRFFKMPFMNNNKSTNISSNGESDKL